MVNVAVDRTQQGLDVDRILTLGKKCTSHPDLRFLDFPHAFD